MSTVVAGTPPRTPQARPPWWIIGSSLIRANRLVSVQINDRCPLRCKHCCIGYSSEFKGSGWKIGRDELVEIVSAIDPKVYRGVSFAGGEASIEPELLRLGGDTCRAHGLSASVVTAPVWAATPAAAARFLDGQPNLDQVVLSFDRYHLEFLKVAHYENALRAVLERRRRVCLHTCYVDDAEKEEMLGYLSAFQGIVSVVATHVVPVGNAGKPENDVNVEYVQIEDERDLARLPRECVVGQTFIGARDQSVHGCCWSNTLPSSPFSFPKRAEGLAATLQHLEAQPLFQALRPRGFLDSLSAEGRESLVRRMKGRRFSNECDICLACMREGADDVWRGCQAPAATV